MTVTYRIESVARTGTSGIDSRTLRVDETGLDYHTAIEHQIALDKADPTRLHRVNVDLDAVMAEIRKPTMRAGFRR